MAVTGFQDLLKKVNEDNQHGEIDLRASGFQEKSGWCDQLLKTEFYQKALFEAKAGDPTEKAHRLQRFWAFYLDEVINDESSLIRILCKTIAMATVGQVNVIKFIETDDAASVFYSVSRGGGPPDIKVIGNKVVRPKLPPGEDNTWMDKLKRFTGTDEDFRKKVKFAIAQFQTSTADPALSAKAHADKFRAFTGYLALTFLRCVIKETNIVQAGFQRLKMIENLKIVSDEYWGESYYPPNPKAVETAKTSLTKTLPPVQLLVSVIVYAIMDPVPALPPGYLESSFLIHVGGNGLQTIALLMECVPILNTNWKTLYDLTNMTATYPSWARIFEFIQKYLSIQSKEKTYFWARVVDHQYFANLKPDNNVFLCGIFAGIIKCANSKSLIEQSTWFVDNIMLATKGLAVGKAVDELSIIDQTEISDRARGILSKVVFPKSPASSQSAQPSPVGSYAQ